MAKFKKEFDCQWRVQTKYRSTSKKKQCRKTNTPKSFKTRTAKSLDFLRTLKIKIALFILL